GDAVAGRGSQGTQPRGAGSGRRLRRDLPLGRAVRSGAGGAQRGAPAQARQLTRTLPAAPHSSRRLLRTRRVEAAVGARGELRPGSSGAGAQARGGIGNPRSMVSHTSIATAGLVLGVSLGAHGAAWCQAASNPPPVF